MEQNRDENEKKKEYLKRYHSAVLAEKAIQQEIDELRMQDETEKTVLRLRYIHWLRWEQIADRMGYGWTHVHRIHGRALTNFKME